MPVLYEKDRPSAACPACMFSNEMAGLALMLEMHLMEF